MSDHRKLTKLVARKLAWELMAIARNANAPASAEAGAVHFSHRAVFSHVNCARQ
jgi:hypothetical protein